MDTKELAALIDAHRPAELRPADWARRAGVAPALIADFRNHGKNVTIKTLLRMCDAVGVRLEVVAQGVADSLTVGDRELLARVAAAIGGAEPAERRVLLGQLALIAGGSPGPRARAQEMVSSAFAGAERRVAERRRA